MHASASQNGLLPSGLMDVLPPLAAVEFRAVHRFLKSVMAFGYDPVIPPLAEYAQTLLAGQGEATSHHVFRVADPLAPQMLALRGDMTGQLARIAGGPLAPTPRPLRLCYAGYTLRTAPEPLKTRRQHTQVGIERFGPLGTAAIAEVLSIALHTLGQMAEIPLTLDLHYPALLAALLADFRTTQHAAIREAVRMKDTTRLKELGAELLIPLLTLAGDADAVLPRLAALPYPAVAAATAEIAALVALLRQQGATAHMRVDLLDLSGYEYYCGIGYALYWQAPALELARGGCYRTQSGEEAVGFTCYINEMLAHLPPEPTAPVRVLPSGTPLGEALALQAEGCVTVFEEQAN